MCKVFVAFLNIYCQVKWRLGEGKWEVGRREKGEGRREWVFKVR
jgi:hypothetical protein